jgi:hypothetical protein
MLAQVVPPVKRSGCLLVKKSVLVGLDAGYTGHAVELLVEADDVVQPDLLQKDNVVGVDEREVVFNVRVERLAEPALASARALSAAARRSGVASRIARRFAGGVWRGRGFSA